MQAIPRLNLMVGNIGFLNDVDSIIHKLMVFQDEAFGE